MPNTFSSEATAVLRQRLLALLVVPLLAVAGPMPKEKPDAKMKRLFGEVMDAWKGYDFALDGDRLVVTIAASVSDTIE